MNPLCRATRKVIRLNMRRPRSCRSIVIQVLPHVVNAVIQPPSIDTLEQLATTMVVFDTVSITAQVGIVLYGLYVK
jgi:hypothetical protein